MWKDFFFFEYFYLYLYSWTGAPFWSIQPPAKGDSCGAVFVGSFGLPCIYRQNTQRKQEVVAVAVRKPLIWSALY